MFVLFGLFVLFVKMFKFSICIHVMCSGTSTGLTERGGSDLADLSSSEGVLVALDLGSPNSAAVDGTFDVVVGVPAASTAESPSGCVNLGVSCFGVYRYASGASDLRSAPAYNSSDVLVTNAPSGDWHNWATVRLRFSPNSLKKTNNDVFF